MLTSNLSRRMRRIVLCAVIMFVACRVYSISNNSVEEKERGEGREKERGEGRGREKEKDQKNQKNKNHSSNSWVLQPQEQNRNRYNTRHEKQRNSTKQKKKIRKQAPYTLDENALKRANVLWTDFINMPQAKSVRNR